MTSDRHFPNWVLRGDRETFTFKGFYGAPMELNSVRTKYSRRKCKTALPYSLSNCKTSSLNLI